MNLVRKYKIHKISSCLTDNEIEVIYNIKKVINNISEHYVKQVECNCYIDSNDKLLAFIKNNNVGVIRYDKIIDRKKIVGISSIEIEDFIIYFLEKKINKKYTKIIEIIPSKVIEFIEMKIFNEKLNENNR